MTKLVILCAKFESQEAKKEILAEMEPFLYKCALMYLPIIKRRIVEMDDLMELGHVAILQAIKKYRLDAQMKFSTYAVWCIKRDLRNFVNKQINYYRYIHADLDGDGNINYDDEDQR